MNQLLDRLLKRVTQGHRRATDGSLQDERAKTDELLESKHRAEEVLRETHERAEDQLETVRQQVDTHLETQAEVLPQVSDKLVEVADTLSKAAESLTAVAGTLKESVQTGAPIDDSTAAATAAAKDAINSLSPVPPLSTDAGGSPSSPEARPGSDGVRPPVRIAESSKEFVEQLADIAIGMAELTNSLAEEREEADQKLQQEREVTDRILDQQLETAAVVIEEQVGSQLELLAEERQATDEDLADERQHTDAAVEHVLSLLTHEQTEHAITQQKFATRNEFLAIVSHDLRTPLSTMSAAAMVIHRSAPADQAGDLIRASADRMRRAIAIMDRLIHDLLDFASFEDGKLQVRAAPEDVGALIHRAVDGILPNAAAKSLSIEVDIPHGPILAKFDPDRMLQVLSNLLQNAIKFTPAGGRIRVSAIRETEQCVVRVTDSGVGIPKEELTSVFERFKQLGSGDRAGLGLGLYIAKWIVEGHGGRIWAESTPGRGSTFLFTLPGC